jgi:hypothetical protein
MVARLALRPRAASTANGGDGSTATSATPTTAPPSPTPESARATSTPDPRRRLAAYEAPDAIGVPAATVRGWAHHGLVYSCGIDQQHRPVYWQTDLEHLRDRPRRGPKRRPTDTAT